jgi:hypothetical protein
MRDATAAGAPDRWRYAGPVNQRLWFLSAGVVVALGLAACGPAPELVLVNRSARDIAFLPGVTVPSCQTLEVTGEQLSAAQAEFDRWWTEAQPDVFGWVPAGALHFERGLVGAPVGAPDPMTVVISSQAEPLVTHGFVPADLPACGGEPVGIE